MKSPSLGSNNKTSHSFTALNLDTKFRIQRCHLLGNGARPIPSTPGLHRKSMVRHLNISPGNFKLKILTVIHKTSAISSCD